MKLIKFNLQNEPYYSKQFIAGFKHGALRQYEADKQEERAKGHYVGSKATGDWMENTSWKCSECGDVHPSFIKPKANFCRQCGADMRGEK